MRGRPHSGGPPEHQAALVGEPRRASAGLHLDRDSKEFRSRGGRPLGTLQSCDREECRPAGNSREFRSDGGRPLGTLQSCDREEFRPAGAQKSFDRVGAGRRELFRVAIGRNFGPPEAQKSFDRVGAARCKLKKEFPARFLGQRCATEREGFQLPSRHRGRDGEGPRPLPGEGPAAQVAGDEKLVQVRAVVHAAKVEVDLGRVDDEGLDLVAPDPRV